MQNLNEHTLKAQGEKKLFEHMQVIGGQMKSISALEFF
jgi:hypothetical protein